MLGDIDGVVQRNACYNGVFGSCNWRGDAVPKVLCTFLVVWNVLPANPQGFKERALPHYRTTTGGSKVATTSCCSPLSSSTGAGCPLL